MFVQSFTWMYACMCVCVWMCVCGCVCVCSFIGVCVLVSSHAFPLNRKVKRPIDSGFLEGHEPQVHCSSIRAGNLYR